MKPTDFFNYNSLRAKQARIARHIVDKQVYWLLVVCGWLMVAGGVALVWLLHAAAGWLVAGLAGPFWVVAAWSFSLRVIPPEATVRTVDDILEVDLLALLPPIFSPQDLGALAIRTDSGRFVALRCGFGPLFIPQISSANQADSPAVFGEAEKIRQQLGAEVISGGMVVAALVRLSPDIDTYLASLHLDKDDLIKAAEWAWHVDQSVALRQRPRHDGGIGRDWSFGYTPLLERFGINLSARSAYTSLLHEQLPSREAMLLQAAHLLSQNGRSNVALVGGLGSGKTALVYILAKRLLEGDATMPPGLHYHQIIGLDPSTLIASARGRGDLEDLIQHLCYEAIKAKNTILFLDDAQLFFEDGNGSVDLTNVLLPILEGGALRLIMAMDEQRWLRISQHTPALAQHVNRVNVTPTSEAETMRLMQDQMVLFEFRGNCLYSYQALQTAYRLSSRFLSDQVMPGRALHVLEAAVDFSENQLITQRSVEAAVEATQGIKVAAADSSEERARLLNLEQLIHQRMINQTRAVQVVSDALRRARAGVRNVERPIGTFLFLGPTGVGKTELAKSVADIYFGGEGRLVRLDMNEYSTEGDVQRLIADPAQDEHSLTAQIGRNPFSVVLLDEIEKAHPNVLNTLLQMLDEGILRDSNNRQISFRDAIVIATSNAGADRIRQHIEQGEKLEQFEEQFTNELIQANIFRPEFLNRFDEIVLFRPLTPDELVQVIDLILQGVNKNLAVQRLAVVVEDDAKHQLVEAGYDPRLGARPMRRVVQRVVENIVANQMLSGQASPGSTIHITSNDVQTMLARSRGQ